MTHIAQRVRNLYGLLKTFGFSYECPLCHWHARRFYPAGFDFPVLEKYGVVGAGRRENVRCPRCNSSSRERFIYLFLTRALPTFRKGKILHIAPERKLQQILQAEYGGKYVSLDISSPRAEIKADVQELPFADKTFEIVICSHVLEHVPDDLKAMREFARTLRPGGSLIAAVPFSPLLEKTFENWSITNPEERARVFGQADHVRIYGTDFKERLERSGLAVSQALPAAVASETEIRRFALNPIEPLFIANKK